MSNVDEIGRVFRKPEKVSYPAYPVKRKPSRAVKLVIILIFVAIGALGLGGYYYSQFQSLKDVSHNPNLVSQIEAKELEKKVSRLMVLPQSELPTVATVSDQTKLADQPFFENASDGDKLLIYAQAKMVVLYSPERDKIINIGPLTVENQSEQAVN